MKKEVLPPVEPVTNEKLEEIFWPKGKSAAFGITLGLLLSVALLLLSFYTVMLADRCS